MQTFLNCCRSGVFIQLTMKPQGAVLEVNFLCGGAKNCLVSVGILLEGHET